MIGMRIFSASLFLATVNLLSATASPVDGEVRARKLVPEDVRKAADDYADTILDAVQILSKDHIKKVSQEKLTIWAIEGLYKRLGKRIPPEIVERLLALRDPKEADLKALLMAARQHLGKGKHLDEFRDMDLSLEGIFAHLEPETKQQPLRETGVSCLFYSYVDHCGIGLEVRKNNVSGFLQVVTPIKDGSAYKAGIRAGDVITRITQEKDERHDQRPRSVSTKGLSVEEAERKLRGHPKSKVQLTVYREDPSKPRNVVVVRDWAPKETVFGVRRTAADSWDYLFDSPDKIAYVRLAAFGRDTPRELARAMVEVQRRCPTGLILDLRGNPDGLFDSAIKIAELYIEKGLITIIHKRDEEQKVISESRGSFLRTPMVCLVDSESTAVSEIVAACLQDHHRAVIIGERSRGKADIQQIIPFHGGRLLFTTVAFFRPNGKPLSKKMTTGKDEDDWGVRPDEGFVVKLSPRERKELAEHLRRLEIIAPFNRPLEPNKPAFRDRQLEKAVEHLRKQARKASS
ncbi:MAG TPA: S41 family peptidase [Gemmataceae bacterium]|jgi:C-terminal peptidase prc